MSTINAATIYAAAIAAADTIRAAATAAGWGPAADKATPRQIFADQVATATPRKATPHGLDMERCADLETAPAKDAPYWAREYTYSHAAQHARALESLRAAVESEILATIPEPSAPEFINIKTSARGSMRIKNSAENLAKFAAKVKANAAAFGGGFTRATSAKKAAKTYSAQALKVWRELMQEKDYAGALQLADEKLDPRFYFGNKGGALMMVAPIAIDGHPELFSAMLENGKYNVQEWHQGRTINSDYAAGTRAKAIDTSMAAWNAASEAKRAAALESARKDAADQAKARAAWLELRGLQAEDQAPDQEATDPAEDIATPSDSVAAIVATAAAMATASASAASTQAEDQARELETCSATSEATAATASTYGHASATSAADDARAMAQAAAISEALRRIQATYAAQRQATPSARTIDNSHQDGAQWKATLSASAGAYTLRFMGNDGAWEPITQHATTRERAQALRALIQKNTENVMGFDDTPELDDTDTSEDQAQPSAQVAADTLAATPSAGQGMATAPSMDQAAHSTAAADYTDTRKTCENSEDYTEGRKTSENPSAEETDPQDTDTSEDHAADYVGTATYSPQDNKLRLTPFARLETAVYQRLKAYGFSWAPKQGVFFATWTPGRADLLGRLAGELEDEDSTTEERAADRAARFEEYSEKREREAGAAYDAVRAIGQRFENGQPILIGHHSERKARKDQQRMNDGMRRAVKLWDTAQYWETRAAASVAHARYLERADVRERRIRTIEADRRKAQRNHDDAAKWLKLWSAPDLTHAQAVAIAGYCHLQMPRKDGDKSDFTGTQSAYGALTDSYPTLYAPRTMAEVVAHAVATYPHHIAHYARWLAHYDNRLAYERAMLAAVGGKVEDRHALEKGGAVKCWASRRGGWSIIQKVNKITVTVLDNWGNGGRDFTRNIEKDKLTAVMTRAQVDAARAAGRLVDETPRGFMLADPAPEATDTAAATEAPETLQNPPQESAATPTPIQPTAQAETAPQRADFDALRATLRNGGAQVVSVPQLFPTPAHLAARMAQLAGLQPGAAVLEPSAGTGMLLAAIRQAQPDTQRTAVELNQTLCNILRNQDKAADVVQGDFLEWRAPGLFDAVIMNPPFGNTADIDHIRHALAMLKPGGRLVAICAGGPRQADQLRPMVDRLGGLWEPLPAGTFAQAGTQVNTVLLCVTAPALRTEDPAATDTPADPAPAATSTEPAPSMNQAAPSTAAADYTDTRKTSQKSTDYTQGRKTLKIADIRRIIDSCNWLRRDYGGHTEGEFMRALVPENMGKRIEAVRALQIPARFARDIESQRSAIEYGEKTIARWHALHAAKKAASASAAPHNPPPTPAPQPHAMPEPTPTPDHMTGAELQTLRENANMTREDLAELAGVQARTIKHWESGRAGVPADVAGLANSIDLCLEASALQARGHIRALIEDHGQPPSELILLRYRSNEDLRKYQPNMAALPACAHGAIINRMRLEARAMGIPARIVWMQPDAYEPWRAACHLPDTESTRAAWAAQHIEAQALPHHQDQPPAQA